MTQTLDFVLEPQNKQNLANLCGEHDSNIKLISERLNIQVFNRGYQFRLIGEPEQVISGRKVLKILYKQADSDISSDTVHLQLMENFPGKREAGNEETDESPESDQLHIRTPRKVIRTRGANQRAFTDQMRQRSIAFGIGPAGTGKTYLAVASAIEAITSHQFERLIITRPAVEAGEKLGFLPGDFSQKVDPYLRPIFDALYDTLGMEMADSLIAKGLIEVAPLAFMRGRSFNNAFVLLDEAQNTTIEQMKMFLTRMGFGSTVVVTGDPGQSDLPENVPSGLRHAIAILSGIDKVFVTEFTREDIVRHPLVGYIVKAYEQDLAKKKKNGRNK